MTSNIAIVIDSSPSMPLEIQQRHHITVVPNLVVWRGKEYKDWEEITPTSLFEGLADGGDWPSTAAPPPASFKKVYADLLERYDKILTIFPPTTITMGVDSARIALEDFPAERITVIETNRLGMANGWVSILAARAAAEGASLAECAALVTRLLPQTGYIGTLNTLAYLHRGGRIGGAARFLGTALNLKPILEMNNSRVEGVMQVRTRRKALQRLFEYLEKSVPEGKRLYLAGMQAAAEDELAQLMAWANDAFEVVEQISVPLPPSNCVHYGPGAVGYAYLWVD